MNDKEDTNSISSILNRLRRLEDSVKALEVRERTRAAGGKPEMPPLAEQSPQSKTQAKRSVRLGG